MGKKKELAKTPPPALASTVTEEQRQMILSPVTRIRYIQEYENELYEMIMAQG
jgi:hypothetical protein